MLKRILFIYNPLSGQGKINSELSGIIDSMIKAGYDVMVYATQHSGDAVKKTAEATDAFDRVVCAGGDGTLCEVVTGLMKSKAGIPVGYIPAGSTNDFANALGIVNESGISADTALSDKLINCDVGQFKDAYFVYVAAFGLFTEVSYTTSQESKNALGHIAYLLEGVRQLTDIPSYRVKIMCDEEEIEGDFIFGMVTNAVTVGGIRGLVSGEVRLDDGVFEVMLINTPKNPLELSEILGFITNLNRDTDLVHTYNASRIEVQSDKSIPWTLDGEFGGSHNKVVINNIPKAIKIAVP